MLWLGRLGREHGGSVLPYMEQQRLALLSQTQLLLPASTPGTVPSLSRGCSPCQAVPQQIEKEVYSCREDRVGLCSVRGCFPCGELTTTLRSSWQ